MAGPSSPAGVSAVRVSGCHRLGLGLMQEPREEQDGGLRLPDTALALFQERLLRATYLAASCPCSKGRLGCSLLWDPALTQEQH